MKVALIHDHLAQDGGAEKVLKVFADMYPTAPIYTLLYEKKNADKYFKNRKIETSIIQSLPGGIKHYQWYMPFMPMAVEFFDLKSYDLVISDASAFAKGVITSPNCLHICYCHTPTRYIWSDTHQYINELKYNKYFKKIISLVLNYIRMWDRMAADRVDKYIANSKTVKRRITKYYKADSTVIYPPVAIDKFNISENQDNYFLIGGRLAPYKRVDIVVEAFKKMGKKLKIFGDGVDLERLKKIAGDDKNIEFLGRVDDNTMAELYRKCQAFINPQEEDFGITPIEAMASGRPVIALKKGGATETVIEGKTGIFFDNQTPEAIIDAVNKFNSNNFNPNEIREHAKQYSTERFKREIKEYIESEWTKFKDS
jgi:glycosyltransferase involved in cell wall biosynthesis